MAVFVLVHGAWHGGWCWKDCATALRRFGHDVHTPTLTGLGERSHLLTADVDADMHAVDIEQSIRRRELQNVVLVGHSYGGVVITGAAGRCAEQIKALIYLDAFVPERSLEPIFAKANPERMAAFQKQIDAGAIGLELDGAIVTWAEDPATRDWIAARCTPHPAKCFTQGVTLTGREKEILHRHYMVAAKNKGSPLQAEYERAQKTSGWTTEELPTLHDAMVEAPELLAKQLDHYAKNLPEAADT